MLKFLIGFFIGIGITVWFTMSLPLYWDRHRHNEEMTLGKAKGCIVVKIGWSPDMKDGIINHGMGEFLSRDKISEQAENGIWDERWVQFYKDKEEAIAARNRVMGAIREPHHCGD
jgi:hypothetical protein